MDQIFNVTSALYYFSTYSQVLAAVIALFAVFIMHRTQRMDYELICFGKLIQDKLRINIGLLAMLKDEKRNELSNAIDKKSISEVDNLLSDIVRIIEINKESITDQQWVDAAQNINSYNESFKSLLEAKFDLIKQVINVTKWVCVSISISLLCLIFVEILATYPILISIAFAITFISIIWIFDTLIKIFKSSL